MTSPSEPQTLWDKSDSLLGGGVIAVRAVAIPVDGQAYGAVAVSLRIPGGRFDIDENGTLTTTVMLGPGEGLGIGAWLRDAAIAADKAGPPLYDWE